MGFWGQHFFQSDRDYDLVGILAHHLGIDDLYAPDDPQQLRHDLDSGKLEAEFRRLRDGAYASDVDLQFLGIKAAIVVLAAAAMRHGAAISDDFREYVKSCLKSRLQMYNLAKDEMAHAMATYRNGVPLDLAGMKLTQVFKCLEVVENECNTCCKAGDDLLTCGRCRKARYCNPKCQKQAWKMHKSICRPAAREAGSS